ncbi:hypothetical protein GOBAR_AA07658 [Gossypium barbadense]|uniref:Uncharacterized protein n=2 Tax=Gossypium TaxID=3633 RepID=A0ABR0MNH0_GOSAR|nr:hypothetical protein PVK06_042767 [Gossypium arboreum]PPS12979.1 hypothetical protein GOBAR_AA07658 [Gossypium barbadense]
MSKSAGIEQGRNLGSLGDTGARRIFIEFDSAASVEMILKGVAVFHPHLVSWNPFEGHCSKSGAGSCIKFHVREILLLIGLLDLTGELLV